MGRNLIVEYTVIPDCITANSAFLFSLLYFDLYYSVILRLHVHAHVVQSDSLVPKFRNPFHCWRVEKDALFNFGPFHPEPKRINYHLNEIGLLDISLEDWLLFFLYQD